MRCFSAIGCLLFLATVLDAQRTHVVGPLELGADFDEIQAAVDAAGAGDTLLLLPGSYPYPAPVLDRGLRILGDPLDPPFVGAWQVVGLPAAEVVALSDLRSASFSAQDCAGVVAVAFLTGAGAVGTSYVTRCADVRVHGGYLEAGEIASSAPTSGVPAVQMYRSRLEVVGSTILGGPGPCGVWFGTPWCGAGGPGVLISLGQLHVVGSTVQGGPGTSMGSPYVQLFSQIAFDPPPTLDLASWSSDGGSIDFAFRGTPGASGTLLVGTAHPASSSSLLPVEVLVDAFESVDLGVVGPSGEGRVSLTPGSWWPDAAARFAQLEVTEPDGDVNRSNSILLPPLRSFSLLVSAALLRNERDAVLALPATSVTTRGNRRALASFLEQAADRADRGDARGALQAIEQAMERVDGCALRGRPDDRGAGPSFRWDWVVTCEDQAAVRTVLEAVRGRLVSSCERAARPRRAGPRGR